MKIKVLLMLFSLRAFSVSICDNYSEPSHYSKIRTNIDKKIETFANHKHVAQDSDMILGKLIKAKSPVVVSWFNKPENKDKSEVETVKAWRLYYAKNILLAKYPNDNPKINIQIEKLVNSILKENFNKVFKEKMEKLFQQAKEKAIEVIQATTFESKKDIAARIKNIKLYWPNKIELQSKIQSPLDIIAWGVAYDSVPNEINMGINSLFYPNEETYISVFAHEIGHSFDSCRWVAFFTGEWPFKKIEECLRSEQSINAKKRDDSLLDKLSKEGKVSAELSQSLKLNPTCTKSIYPPIGTQADQLPESFADWFSAEVMSRFSALDNHKLRQDLCEKKELVSGSSYPENINRLERIYLANPKILKATVKDSKNNPKYCSFSD